MKNTEWTDSELQKMLELRVKAYSLKRTSISDLFINNVSDSILKLLIKLSYKLPRDVNRLMEAIIAEFAPDASEDNLKVDWPGILLGITRFSSERAQELYSDFIERVLRFKKLNFTISDVAATFKITGRGDEENIPDQKTATNRARNVVEKWKSMGIVIQLEPIIKKDASGRVRSVNQYEIVDPSMAFLCNQEEFLIPFKPKQVVLSKVL